MSHWNYRILSEVVGDHTEYFVAEVYYNDAGETRAWSERDFNPISGWDDLEDLKGTIKQVQDALEKPVLRVMGNKLVEWS